LEIVGDGVDPIATSGTNENGTTETARFMEMQGIGPEF
jgi:hypothetical protein